MNFNTIIENSHSWDDFRSSIGPLRTVEKGHVFEQLVQLYLKLNPLYVTTPEHVWLLSELPESVHEELHLPSDDVGIDLICKTVEGDYWAVQACL